MQYQKLDAPLTAALHDAENPDDRDLSVFIHTAEPLQDSHVAYLHQHSIGGVKPGQRIVTATLSAKTIGELTALDWVKYIRLSQKLNLLSTSKRP